MTSSANTSAGRVSANTSVGASPSPGTDTRPCTSICADADTGVLVLVLELTDSCRKIEYKVQTRNLF